jgi:hypothetical protein
MAGDSSGDKFGTKEEYESIGSRFNTMGISAQPR